MPAMVLVPEDSNYTAVEQALVQVQPHMPLKEFGVVDIAMALEREQVREQALALGES